jgi:galactokinase
MSPGAAEDKATLLRKLAGELRALRGGEASPDCAFFVPGRVEFLGKHTDYAGGRSLVCAIERGICLVAAPRADAQVRILDVGRTSAVEFALDPGIGPSAGHWSNFPMTVARRLARDFPGTHTGANIAFASDLPRASGMSSSSALIVAVFFALAQVNSLWQTDGYRRAIATHEELAGYIAAIESGTTFGAFSGGRGVGTHGGSEDHVAILCSRAGFLRQYSFCPVRFEKQVRFPGDHVLVIGVSGVKADKTGDAREAYNRASGAARKILKLWRTTTSREDASLAAAVSSAPGTIEQLRQILRESHDAEYPAELFLHRLEQFVEESNEIVPAAAEALARADFERLGVLVDRSQLLAETLLANQVAETAELARTARELGAVAASAFGAGFGGSVWALIPSDRAEGFRRNWAAQYHRRFPERAAVSEFFLSPPGPGLVQFE